MGSTCLSLVATMLMAYFSLSFTNTSMYHTLSSAGSLPWASLQILYSQAVSGSTINSTLAGISNMSRTSALRASAMCACSVT